MAGLCGPAGATPFLIIIQIEGCLMFTYFKVFGIAAFLFFWIFFAGPYCISAKQNELVIGFIVASVVALPLVAIFITKTTKEVVMRFSKFLVMAIAFAVVSSSFVGCSKVPAGNVGIKFYLLGAKKGVDYEVLTPGKYYIGINEELYTFPTFTQNVEWTKDHDKNKEAADESFNFQDRQGLELNADIGITYHLEPSKVPDIFQKYKKGISEITDIFLKNMVRDALVNRSSKLDVEYIYGEGREGLLKGVESDIKKECDITGIVIEKLYWIGRIKLPESVKRAIDSKINATQIAQQRENELREAGINFDDIAFIIEDRNLMVKKWRELGLICLQPFEGDF
jgi:regulator of protease activity HflC (stomatin/prohibitin superfamily)